MPIVEELKRIVERVTGIGRPRAAEVDRLTRPRSPEVLRLREGAGTPNNPRLPLLVYRDAVAFADGLDPAAVLEDVFARHGWVGAWRDGVYDYLHFHTGTHEVLGIARGRVTVQVGGTAGPKVVLRLGDVAVLPAGTAHCRVRASRDLLVVGAYPADGRYDEPTPGAMLMADARRAVARVPRPRQDPVYGRDGPLTTLWKPVLSPRQRQVARARRAAASARA
ncbi:MAG: cupin [Reyranellaceae bacterium]